MKKLGLGRGLDALLPDTGAEEGGVRQVPVSQIDRNPGQPRTSFDDDTLSALSESIRSSGILQPLLVTEQENGRYTIVAGERRFRAARLASLSEVPCLVKTMTREEAMAASLIENLQREDLNPAEEAEGIRALMDQCGLTQEQVAARLGQSRPAVANTLRLLTLDKEMLDALRTGKLSAGHGRVLAGIRDEAFRAALFQKALREHLSVRQMEALAADGPAPAVPARPKPPVALAPELSDMRERLRSAVGVKNVLFQGNGKKGKITLAYNSPEELDLIYAALETLEGR